MKKLIVLIITIFITLSCCACNSYQGNKEITEKSTYSEAQKNAFAILDELKTDRRVQDFIDVYNILISLPNNEKKFISKLQEANNICQKYDIELDNCDYYTLNYGISQEQIEKYKSNYVYYNICDLMEVTVYPALFDKYGYDAQCIKGINADEVIKAIRSTNSYIFDSKKEAYDGYTEKWKHDINSGSTYQIEYHENGLVESINIPIARSTSPFTNEDYEAFFEKDINAQKEIAGNRFWDMSNQFSTISIGREVLDQIFTTEEIEIISNYIHSLTIDDIWERNLTSYVSEPTTYAVAIVCFNYKGYDISIRYNLNGINLGISGANDINELTSRWYTVWCGLGFSNSNEMVNDYKTYINKDAEANNIIQDWQFDLTANANKYNFKPTPIPSELELYLDSYLPIVLDSEGETILISEVASTYETTTNHCNLSIIVYANKHFENNFYLKYTLRGDDPSHVIEGFELIDVYIQDNWNRNCVFSLNLSELSFDNYTLSFDSITLCENLSETNEYILYTEESLPIELVDFDGEITINQIMYTLENRGETCDLFLTLYTNKTFSNDFYLQYKLYGEDISNTIERCDPINSYTQDDIYGNCIFDISLYDIPLDNYTIEFETYYIIPDTQ